MWKFILLNILYPFAPFISIELNKNLINRNEESKFNSLPDKVKTNYDGDFLNEIKIIKDFVVGIRSLRKNLSIKPGNKIVCYYNLSVDGQSFIDLNKNIIEELCNLELFNNISESNEKGSLISNHTNSGTISIEIDDDTDFSAQISKLSKDLKSLKKIAHLSESKLNNKGFLNAAPDDVIKEEKNKLKDTSDSIREIESLILQLK